MTKSDKANFELQIHLEQTESVIGTNHLLLKKNIFMISLEWLGKQIPF